MKDMKDKNRPLFPARLFVYGKDGMHDEGFEITEGQFNGPGVRLIIRRAIADGVEVRMVDPDDVLLLHINGGKVLFPDERAIAGIVADRLIGDEETG